MERFKRDCHCPTAVGDDMVAFSSSSSSSSHGNIGSSSQPHQTNSCKGNELNACRSASAIHLKLLGATCLHMASKLEDVAYVGVRDFLLLMANSDPERNTYRVADILQLEETLLTRSNFEMYLPTVIDFLHTYFDCIPGLKELEPIQNLSKFLGEVSLLFPSIFAQRHAPSVIATSVLSYAMSYFGFRDADSALRDVSEYRTVDIIACVHSVASAHKCIERKHIYSAVTQKYSTLKFSMVSQLPAMSLSDRITFLNRLNDLDQH
jgi:Cyclin, C-terminal domain/Cyclin, N-terminal domain